MSYIEILQVQLVLKWLWFVSSFDFEKKPVQNFRAVQNPFKTRTTRFMYKFEKWKTRSSFHPYKTRSKPVQRAVQSFFCTASDPFKNRVVRPYKHMPTSGDSTSGDYLICSLVPQFWL